VKNLSEAWLEIIGSSGGAPTPSSWPPSILLFYHGLYGLLDVGEGTQLRLVEKGIGPGRIDFIAVTHMHGDHIFGLPGLIQSMSLSSRSKDLIVIGPERIKTFLEETFGLTNFSPVFKIIYSSPINASGLTSGKAKLVIKGFKTCHADESYGYVVTGYKVIGGDERKIFKLAYTGDTALCDEMVRALRAEEDIDVLIHDSTFNYNLRNQAREYGHSTSIEAAALARELNVRALLLFHMSSRYKNSYKQLLMEARSVYEKTFLASDNTKFIIA
jgi:ribonuclease Z